MGVKRHESPSRVGISGPIEGLVPERALAFATRTSSVTFLKRRKYSVDIRTVVPCLLCIGISAEGSSSSTRQASIRRPILLAHLASQSLAALPSGACVRIRTHGHGTKLVSKRSITTVPERALCAFLGSFAQACLGSSNRETAKGM